MGEKMTWFRMCSDFLTDSKIIALSFENQRHFVGVVALSAAGALDCDCDGALMDGVVARRLSIDCENIGGVKRCLVDAGLIDDVWQPVARDKPASEPSETLPACPHTAILALFAEILPELPQPRIWAGANTENLKKRWRWMLSDLKEKDKPHDTDAGIDSFRGLFDYVKESDFLCGRVGEWGGADLGWIVKSANFTKIIQGNYANKERR